MSRGVREFGLGRTSEGITDQIKGHVRNLDGNVYNLVWRRPQTNYFPQNLYAKLYKYQKVCV